VAHGEYDLEDRTLDFAKAVRQWIKQLPRTACNENDVRQLARSSGSVGANYIEANEALSKKDRICRMKISRKVCKESRYWLRLLNAGENAVLEAQRLVLLDECQQLRSILSAILIKLENSR
jgi:four helix bundle protein